uniref:Reverse transcriptase domain-containing protein n=1 Tax=Seriola dumerili TaxID=41447 RepID=A0A3B4TAU6_SERDU
LTMDSDSISVLLLLNLNRLETNFPMKSNISVKYGVPQVSFLGHLLFSHLPQIICNRGINLHCYTNAKLCMHVKPFSNDQIRGLLVLSTTEILVIGGAQHRHQFDHLAVTLDDLHRLSSLWAPQGVLAGNS